MVNYLPLNWWERFWKLVTTWQQERRWYWKKWRHKRYAECICDCWKTVRVPTNNLRSWYTRSCWCNKVQRLESGLRFWRLTTLWEHVRKDVSGGKWFEKCICDCWNEVRVCKETLLRWDTKSCWCLGDENRKNLIERNTTHWDGSAHHSNRLYRIYRNIIARCKYEYMDSYKYYWWKWIKCLWKTYEEFKRDMWPSYTEHVEMFWEADTTIERLDNDWDYCKENCVRATRKEQANHTSRNK